ncbi:LamG domain-containing protein [Dactylosporangium sp. NPDC000244]|uniref:LamG domain-containing protein n=1 Tax=Dactylosporangium sp. NPDC000244 TaxID=3154365 RepID=UPI003331AD63
MTSFDQQLLVHLRLDALTGGRAPDSSAHARHGTTTGSPLVVPDDDFGSSVRFAGADTVTVANVAPSVPSANPVHTVAGWVRLDKLPARRSWLLLLGQPGVGAYHWLLEPNGSTQLGRWGGPSCTPVLPLGRWVHVATTHDGKLLTCYLDGQPAGAAIPAVFGYTGWGLALAAAKLGELGFAGRMAGVRVYERALTAAEVRQVIEEDRSAMAAFRRSHPLAFSLHDTDVQPVLAIVDDPAGQKMVLEVTNTASQSVALAAVDAKSTACHLELQFRPGVLMVNPKAPPTVAVPDGWTARTAAGADGFTVSLTGKAGLRIKPDETVRFTLGNVGADGRGGTRGTRVQLRYDQMTYVDETSLLTGSRVQHLSLVNRRGQQHIPLDAGFVGVNGIVDDGVSPSNLRLRITNVSRRPIPITPSTAGEPSTLIFSFDAQPADVALGARAALERIDIRADRWVTTSPTAEGMALTWRMTTPSITALAAGESILVDVKGMVAAPPSGHARLLVHYENMPGYWDGHLAVTIEKGPLVVRDATLPDKTLEARVGVATNNPEGRLHVLHTPQDGNGNAVIVGPTNGANLRLGYHQNYSWVQSHGAKPLAINPVGNPVSIGGADAQGNTLFVNGVAKVLGLSVGTSHRFGRMLAGHFVAGPHTGGVKEVRVDFPERFGVVPHATVTARSEGYYTDTFAVTVKYIDQSHFKVNILRLDALNAGWQQNLRLDWIAWE